MTSDFLMKTNNLYQQFKEHDAIQTDRLHRYRNIEPESAELLNILIRTQQSKRILEIGTSTGYSTLWLAYAAQSTGGRVITVEIDASRTEIAKQNAIEFSLDQHIEFIVSDACLYLANIEEKFDFILLDAERDAYCKYWNYLPKILKEQGGILIVDNVISHAKEVEEFINLVNLDPHFITTTLPIGAGLFLITYI